jgi:hypothetical protein
MSARKFGRFAAGLFVALGLVFGGALAASAAGSDTTAVAGGTSAISKAVAQLDFDWS